MAGQFVSVKQAFSLSVGSEITLRGWVRSRRDSKGITFIELNDGSRFKSMQLVVEAGAIAEETLKQITTGSSLEAGGVLVESPAKGQAVELKVASVHVYGTADATTYPLQKKGHTLEFLREISHLRVRSNTFGAAFRVRNASDPRDPHVFPGARFSLRADADHHHFGLRRRGADVRRDDVEFAAAAARDRRQGRLAARFFRQAGLSDCERPARRRDLRVGVLQSLHFRPDVSRREQQHAAPPGRVLDDRAGNGFLRSRRTTCGWPRSF